MIDVQINQKAYDIIYDMKNELIEVLQVFGIDVWENNHECFEGLSKMEVRDAFVQIMLDQLAVAQNFNPIFV